jgi:hypothetical protein
VDPGASQHVDQGIAAKEIDPSTNEVADPITPSSGNVFRDLGFGEDEAEHLRIRVVSTDASVGSGAFPLSLDLLGDVLDGQTLKEIRALCGVVAAAGSKLIKEANRIHDAELLDEDIRGSLSYLRDGLKLGAHFVTSGTRPSADTTLQAKP